MMTLTLAARYLSGRKLRTFLTTLAVIFGVFVLFGMNLILPAMIRSFQANVLAASNQVDATITHITGEAFPMDVLTRVQQVEGVVAASGSLNRIVNVLPDYFDANPAHPDDVTALSLIGLDPAGSQTLRVYAMSQGRFLEPGDTNAAIISDSLAKSLGLQLGGTLSLPSAQGETALTIVGIRPARTIPGNEEVIVPLAQAQAMMSQPGQLNTIEANFTPSTDAAARAANDARLQAALGDHFHLEALPNGTELLSSLQVGQTALSAFGVLALLMGAFIIFNTFRTVVVERRHDIGMLRAVGASRSTIIGLFLAEGLLQGVIGTLIGMALGYLLAVVILSAFAGVMQSFVHLTLGPPVITPGLVAISLLLGIGTTLVAGLLPAFSASRVTPLEALSASAAEARPRIVRLWAIVGAVAVLASLLILVSGNLALMGLGALLVLIGLVLLAPVMVMPVARLFGRLAALTFAHEGTASLAENNLGRQPTRAAVTASTTMIGLAIVIATFGMLSSFRGTFFDMLHRSLGSDYILLPPAIALWGTDVGASGDLVQQLRAVDGVGLVTSLRYAATAMQGSPVSLLGVDPATYPQVSGLTFTQGEAGPAYAALGAGRSVILNGILAASLAAKLGDTIDLVTPEGTQPYTVAAVASDYLNAKIATAYVSQASLAADFNKTDDVMIQFNLAPGADRAKVEPLVNAITAKYPQFHLVSGQAYFEENATIFDAAFIGLYVLFLLLAIPSLIAMVNTL
ncbi:MAG: ABC transporter permease, partial [Anaerolineales bacterium]